MFGLVTRRWHKAEIEALRSQNDALRERCEIAEENERTERAARRTITRQFAEAEAANKRLDGRVKELTERLAQAADGSEATDLVRQIDHAKGLITDLQERQATTLERARKAEALLEAHAVVHGECPIEGGARRPQPSSELLQARAHARALDKRLAEVTAVNQRCRCGGAA